MLYQYTNISSLALILSKRTIRFSALNLMDDLQEQETADIKNLGRFVFVSCWTEDEEEQIPMWKMYTDLDSGVRISLPKYPFAETEIKAEDFMGMYSVPHQNDFDGAGIKTVIPLIPLIKKKVITQGLIQQKDILRNIEYTSDREKLYPKVLSESYEGIKLSINKLGYYKNEGWSFQKEWRYILRFMPLDISDVSKAGENFSRMVMDVIAGKAVLPFSHYELGISDNAFSKMEIMLSPKINPGNRLIVEDLISKYNPSANIVESRFKDTLA